MSSMSVEGASELAIFADLGSWEKVAVITGKYRVDKRTRTRKLPRV